MARISAELAKQREDMVYSHFFADPEASVKQFNDTLEQEHGFRMNLSRIYQIRNRAVEAALQAAAEKAAKEQQS